MADHTLSYHQHHIGSFLRPSHLVKARELQQENRISEEDVKKVEDTAIRSAVKIQKDLGYEEFNDGEYLRINFWETFFDSLSGFEYSTQDFSRFLPLLPWGMFALKTGSEPGMESGMTLHCVGKIEFKHSINLAELKRLHALVPPSSWPKIRLTIVSPMWHYIRYTPGKAYADAPYTTDEEYFDDLIAAYQMEIQLLYEEGLKNLQIDVPEFSFYCDPRLRAGWKDANMDADDVLSTSIKVLNRCLESVPDDMHISLHVCHGNFRSLSFASGDYETVAAALFNSLPRVSTYFLEYDSPLSGSFNPLRHLPVNKNVILGVISTKHGKLENLSELKSRVLEAADIVAQASGQTRKQALKRMGVSPQCGFESAQGGNDLDEMAMHFKLMLVRVLAQEVFA